MKIARHVIDDLVAHARADAPHECCGLLIGDRREVNASMRARNREAGPTRYLIDPEDHFAAIHAARTAGKRVVGAYHSHPQSAPVPSEADIAEATGGSDFLYVIVSLSQPAGEIKAYRIVRGSLVPVAYDVVSND